MTRTRRVLIQAIDRMIAEHKEREGGLATDFMNLRLALTTEDANIEEKRVYHLANEAALFEDEIEELLDLADTMI